MTSDIDQALTAAGYQYGADALDNARTGWNFAHASLVGWLNDCADNMDKLTWMVQSLLCEPWKPLRKILRKATPHNH